jgi:hypothetical protein
MEKNIKDYLHLYMGCPLIYEVWGQECEEVHGVRSKKITAKLHPEVYLNIIQGRFAWAYNIILRPLSDMTKVEVSELRNIWSDGYETGNNYTSIIADAAQIKWLLSKHFDLFGLIPAGLAIDATKQNTNL